MGMGKRPGQTSLSMKVTIRREPNMERALIHMLMAPNTKAISVRIIIMALELSPGTTASSMLASGKATTCTAKAHSLGQMAASMKANTNMTKSKASAYTLGRMAECTQASGKMANNTATDSTRI